MKRGLELVSLPHFLHNFWRKRFSCYILLIGQVSLSGCLYFVRYLEIFVLQFFVNRVVTSEILKFATMKQIAQIILEGESRTLNFLRKLDILSV